MSMREEIYKLNVINHIKRGNKDIKS